MSKIQWLLAALGVALARPGAGAGRVRPGGRRPRHDPQVHHDDAGHWAFHRHRQPRSAACPAAFFRGSSRPGTAPSRATACCWCTCAAWSWPTRPPFRPRCRAPTGPRVRRLVSCQAISAADAATVTNVSTAVFPASTAGNADINATVSLPHPCIAPIVFVASPVFGWFAATGREARASSSGATAAGRRRPVPSPPGAARRAAPPPSASHAAEPCPRGRLGSSVPCCL